MAVNTVQNRLEEVEQGSPPSSFDSLRYAHNGATKAMLGQVYDLVLDTNRKAAARTLGIDEERPPSKRGSRANGRKSGRVPLRVRR